MIYPKTIKKKIREFNKEILQQYLLTKAISLVFLKNKKIYCCKFFQKKELAKKIWSEMGSKC